jgi:hypothetical protein
MTAPTRDEVERITACAEVIRKHAPNGMPWSACLDAAREICRVHSQPGGALAEPPAVIWNGKTGLFERPASAPPEPAGGEATAAAGRPFQSRVDDWMQACFGPEISSDKTERNHRFVEEALELAQSCGCTASEAHQLVDYVFGRPVGEPSQEVGGVMVTLAALCLAHGMSMEQAGKVELARVWTKVEAIRAKQAAKPKHSPLPGLVAALEAILECVTEDGRTKERTRQAALRDMRQFADAALRRLAGEREGE